jgi:hypothetical protein
MRSAFTSRLASVAAGPWWQQLFDPNQPDSMGQRVQGLVFELAMLRGVLDDLWVWTQILPTLPGPIAPHGVARMLDLSCMYAAPWARFNALLTFGCLLLGFFRLWRGAYLAALVTYHFHYAARYSVGKVGHGSNVLAFVLLALGIAHLAYRDPVLRRRASVGFTLVLLSVGYTWAAVCKLSAAGFGWADGRHLRLWIREKWIDTTSLSADRQANWLQHAAMRSVAFSTLILGFGLACEALSSLMLLRRVRRYVLLALAGMHLGILYTMNIAFMNNVYVLLAIALPIAELVDRYVVGTRFAALLEAQFARLGAIRERIGFRTAG